MKLLAYDTSGDTLSLGIYEDRTPLWEQEMPSRMRHSMTLFPVLEKALKSLQLKLAAIDVVAPGLGPGSFTGLRVGIMAAKIFGHVLKKKIAGVCSMEALALRASETGGEICVLLEAKKGKVYAAGYRKASRGLECAAPPHLSTIEEALRRAGKRCFFLGDASWIYREKIRKSSLGAVNENPEWNSPKAFFIAQAAFGMAKKNSFTTPEDLGPLYLHPRDCSVTGKK